MSPSIPLATLKSLLQDAFPTAEEARDWLRERCGAVDEGDGPLTDDALAPLAAQPGEVVLTRLLDAAPFLVDRVRILAASSGLTLPTSAFDEAEFAVRRCVGALVHVLAGGDYGLAFRFFHRSFAWGGRAADVEPGHALASLDRLTDNLLQLGAHKQEELFKVLLAEHPGHAEEIQRLARWMGHFTLAPTAPPAPAPSPPPAPSLLARLLTFVHRARIGVVAWPRPSRFALLLVPSMTVCLVFLTASTPLHDVESTLLRSQVEALSGVVAARSAEIEERERTIERQEEENSRLTAERDELKQEVAALVQKDGSAQAALEVEKKRSFDLGKNVALQQRRYDALYVNHAECNNALNEALEAATHPPVQHEAASPPAPAPRPPTP